MALVIPDKIDLGTRPKAWKSSGDSVVGTAPNQNDNPKQGELGPTNVDTSDPTTSEPSTIRGEESGAYTSLEYEKLKGSFG